LGWREYTRLIGIRGQGYPSIHPFDSICNNQIGGACTWPNGSGCWNPPCTLHKQQGEARDPCPLIPGTNHAMHIWRSIN